MNTNTPRGHWLITLTLAGAATAYLMLVFLPCKRTIAERRRELRNKQEFILSAGQVRTQIHAVAEDLARTRDYYDAWRGRPANSAGVAALFGEIAELARTAGVRTTRFAPGAAIEYEQLRRIPATLVCVGSFVQVQAFLAGLEASTQRIWVKELKLEGSRESGETVECELNLAIFADNRDISD
jgi:Tfp pilus assembly protein PilO